MIIDEWKHAKRKQATRSTTQLQAIQHQKEQKQTGKQNITKTQAVKLKSILHASRVCLCRST
jgi:hypothetical protein